MEKIFHTGEKIFFTTLIICIVSYLYFTMVPLNEITLNIGYIFLLFYFGINFYIGSISDLNIREAFLSGIIGCGVGLFLLIFAMFAQIIMQDTQFALWIMKPYYIPTISLVEVFFDDISMLYPIILMIINISLVVIGCITKNIMNKFKL